MRGWLTVAAAWLTVVAVSVRTLHPVAVVLAVITVALLLWAAAGQPVKES